VICKCFILEECTWKKLGLFCPGSQGKGKSEEKGKGKGWQNGSGMGLNEVLLTWLESG